MGAPPERPAHPGDTEADILDLRVHRKNMDVPQALRESAERKLARLAPFLDASGWIELGFVEEQNPRIPDRYHCEIVAHLRGRRLKVEGSAGEPFAALDVAMHKVDQQVRRLKDRRVRRRKGNHANLRNDGNHGPLRAHEGAVPPPAEPGARSPNTHDIVRVERPVAKPMTPDEAALQLEALGYDFLLFTNAETDRAAVLYRRGDGRLGFMEAGA